MMNYYGGNPFGSIFSGLMLDGIAMAICFILALAGGIVLYFTFLSPRNEGKFKGFLGWLYQFLNFQKLMLETLLKIFYVIGTAYLVLYSLYVLFTGNFLIFLATFVGGVLITRIVYEFLLLLILICRNVSDINRKMKANGEGGQIDSSAKAPEFQEAPVYNWGAPAQEPTPPPPPPEPACPGCGRKFGPDEAFCVNCGTKLK